MSQSAWWERPDLRYIEGRLFFGNHDLDELARSAGTPLFAYYGPRIKQSLEQVHATLAYYWRNQDTLDNYLQAASEHEESMMQEQVRYPSPAVKRLHHLVRERRKQNYTP